MERDIVKASDGLHDAVHAGRSAAEGDIVDGRLSLCDESHVELRK